MYILGYSEYPHSNFEDTDFRELIAYYREVRDKYDGTLNAITALDKRLTAYEADVNGRINGTVESAMNTYKGIVQTEMDRRFANIEQSINNKLSAFNQSMKEYENSIDIEIARFESEMYDKFHQLERYVTQRIDKIAELQIESTNNMSNSILEWADVMLDTIQQVSDKFENEINNLLESLPLEIKSVKWLWNNAVNYDGFTAYEWYNFPVTCEQWNKSGVTCATWYTAGKHVFDWYGNQRKFFSPLSGEWSSAGEVVVELCSKLMENSLTAGEYDAMRLTADEYDTKFITGAEYDWTGRMIIERLFDWSNRKER